MYKHTLVKAKIRYLCDTKGIVQKNMLSDLGYNVNLLTQATGARGLSGAALYAIADYLDVSVDYLLDRTDKPEVNK